MAKQINDTERLDPQVKEQIESFLREQGHNVDNLTEDQITEMYWTMLAETIESSEDNPMEIDDAKRLSRRERDTVVTYVDGDPVRVTDDEVVGEEEEEVGEEEIMEMVRENQNPIMSKSELISEMRRQIVTEANQYEDELESGDNDYARHLDPDSVRDMGRELYNDIRQAAEEKLGGADYDRAAHEMSRSLQNILMFEMQHKDELEQEAINLVREKYGSLTEEAVDIQAEITGHPGLGGRPITKGNVQLRRGNTPPPEGYTEEELKPEITKRRIINGMTHGAARKGQNLYHMAGDKLRGINPNATEDYSKVMAANDFLYWAMDKQTIDQQSAEGDHAGNVRVVIQEGGKPKIIAQGMTFSFLLHELVKGVMELMSLHGTHEDREVGKYVEDKTDTLEAEPDDIRLGVGIWEKVSQFIDIEDSNHEALFYHKLVTLPAEQFNELMRGLVAGNAQAIQMVQGLADDASSELSQENYDDAVGTYDEPEEAMAGGDEEDEYADPELERLLGGGSDEPVSDEPEEINYSAMGRVELQRHMDAALDAGDLGLAAQIGAVQKQKGFI